MVGTRSTSGASVEISPGESAMLSKSEDIIVDGKAYSMPKTVPGLQKALRTALLE